MLIWKIGFPRCPRTHPGPNDTLKWPREGQNWRQCTSCGPTNWFWAKKTKFESVRSKVCSFHPESACYNRVAEPRIRWRLLLRQELWCLFLGNPEVRRSWRFSVLTLLVASLAHQLLLSHYITHSLQRLKMRTKASPNIRVLLGF